MDFKWRVQTYLSNIAIFNDFYRRLYFVWLKVTTCNKAIPWTLYRKLNTQMRNLQKWQLLIYSILIDMLIIQNPRKRNILNLQLSVSSPRHSERAAFCLIGWLLLWYISQVGFPSIAVVKDAHRGSLSNNSSLLLLSRHLNRIVNIWKFRAWTFSLDFFCVHNSVNRCGSREFFFRGGGPREFFCGGGVDEWKKSF